MRKYEISDELRLAAHTRRCRVCLSTDRAALEEAYREGTSQVALAKEYDVSITSIGSHIKYFGLADKREDNFTTLVNSISVSWLLQVSLMEKIPDSIGAKMVALSAKIRGLLVERVINLSEEFQGKSEAELLFYAQHGRWPIGEESLLTDDGSENQEKPQ